jgi:RNA polymerase primary sigma factor
MGRYRKKSGACFVIGQRVYRQLCNAELKLLTAAANEFPFFVDNGAFHSPGAEKVIMTQTITPADIPSGVLTLEQEQLLFLQYNYCRYQFCSCVQDLRRGRITNVKDARRILYWFLKAAELRNILAQANLSLVRAMAHRTRHIIISLDDITSEGNLAVLRTIDKFDVVRGCKFSTYACRAILAAFRRESEGQVFHRRCFPVSYDTGMEKDKHLDTDRNLESSMWLDALIAILRDESAGLNSSERKVVAERFGLSVDSNNGDTTVKRTLEEIGGRMGMSKERVRQIQNSALKKLRAALEELINR